MDVINMPAPILFVLNRVLPKSPLPHGFLASVIDWRFGPARYKVLDVAPTTRIIRIPFWQLPYGVQMVRHDHRRLDLKRPFALYLAERFPQQLDPWAMLEKR